MTVSFRYLHPISSKEFNSRFADAVGGSLLSGFYFEQGTNPFDVTLSPQHDASSIMIFPNGIRIEEETPLRNAFSILENTTQHQRKDWVYAYYTYGRRETTVEYFAISGDREPSVDSQTHKLIGAIIVPPNARSFNDCEVEYVTRGLHLKDVANDVRFKGALEVNTPLGPKEAANKEYVDNLRDTYTNVAGSNYVDEAASFTTMEYKRADGSLYARTTIKNFNENFNPTEIEVKLFDTADQVIDQYTWHLEYETGNIVTRKYKA